MFLSPQEKSKIQSFPLLQEDTPSRPRMSVRSASKDPNLDAVHLAERDLMEDEDMSVLLQLASNNTPRSTTSGPVFRTSADEKSARVESGSSTGGGDRNLPALQLPMIGGSRTDGSNARGAPRLLERKSRSGSGNPLLNGARGDDSDDVEYASGDPFAPPTLNMRSKDGEAGAKPQDKTGSHPAESSSNRSSSATYALHAPYPHPHQSYYPMPPPGLPPGSTGSLRVTIGSSKNGSPPRTGGSPHAPPPHYPEYPYPPGMYSQYGPPPPMGYPAYQGYAPPPPSGRHVPVYGNSQPSKASSSSSLKKSKPSSTVNAKGGATNNKRSLPLTDAKTPAPSSAKKQRKTPSSSAKKVKKVNSPSAEEPQKTAASIQAINAANGGHNDKAAALAAAILRGVTMRPSGKWQAQLYFAGKSRYIGVFDTQEKAALAYEIAREKLKSGPQDASGKNTENLVNAARKAAFDGVNEKVK